jgi:MoxR-like ATPase
LPEAQLDRFLFNIMVDYPSWDEEVAIVERISVATESKLASVLGKEEILALQKLVRRIPAARQMVEYATALARATRSEDPSAPGFVKKMLSWGAGPRASLNLIVAAKARAGLRGRFYVAPEDIQAVAKPILRHRIVLNFAAQAEGQTPDNIIDKLLVEIDPNKGYNHASAETAA